MKITLNLQKLHLHDIAAIKNHNTRDDGIHAEPASVLPKHLHFGENRSEESDLYQSRLDTAKSLAKRKDAVIVQSFLFQVGDKKDWRNEDGSVKLPPPIDIEAFAEECFEFTKTKYGVENILRYDLHMDESSPHLTIWAVPIDKSGKLAQKSFIDGTRSMKDFRAALESQIMARFPNVPLERGSPGGGGKKHDPGKGTWPDHIEALRAESERLARLVADRTEMLESINAQIGASARALQDSARKVKDCNKEIDELHKRIKNLESMSMADPDAPAPINSNSHGLDVDR